MSRVRAESGAESGAEFAAGLEHHRAGRLDAAEAAYRRALAADGAHTEALHLLGVLAHQSARHE